MDFIYARDRNNGIGKKGVMAWSYKKDFNFFRQVTTFNPGGPEPIVIMGRTTYESLPTTLKGRYSVVLSSKDFVVEHGEVVHTLDEVKKIITDNEGKVPVYCIGGASLFKALVGMATSLYITTIDEVFDCDTFVESFEDNFIIKYSFTLEDENRYTKETNTLTFTNYVREEN